MRGYEVIVWDMWMIGKEISVVVDMVGGISCLIFTYKGNYDLYSLKRKFKIGEKTLVGISRDFTTITTQEEFMFCCAWETKGHPVMGCSFEAKALDKMPI